MWEICPAIEPRTHPSDNRMQPDRRTDLDGEIHLMRCRGGRHIRFLVASLCMQGFKLWYNVYTGVTNCPAHRRDIP